MKTLSVAWKDIQILLKDPGALIVSFLLPLVFILAFSMPKLAAASEPSRLALPLVNLDAGSAASQEFVSALNAAGGVEVAPYSTR
jgi:ABC-2 type transport system permease protein